MSLYEKFDSAAMTATNKLVMAWNWTTGRTKSDLANSLVYFGGAAIPAGSFIRDSLIGGAILSLFYLPLSVMLTKRNKQVESTESSALERGLKDLRVEKIKESYGQTGLVFTLGGSTQLLSDPLSAGDYCSFAGIEAIALAHYVMRADCLPPRKNVLSRAADSLKEAIQQPALQTVPIKLNYSGD
ncbi:hypothetical protein KA107_02650 [Candidatus Pacearchaeota archaeon]|nr:hypothetical protein [Candidatus Pacearchaeota archaeon]